jgi:hypothetical protein
MKITLAIGVFFLFLAAVFGLASWADYRKAERHWTSAGVTRRRIAIIFALVGLGLVLLGRFNG